MSGKIIQINISTGGLPKRPIPQGLITPFGIEGDFCAHPAIHGGASQAVLLIAAETVDELIARGPCLSERPAGLNVMAIVGVEERDDYTGVEDDHSHSRRRSSR